MAFHGCALAGSRDPLRQLEERLVRLGAKLGAVEIEQEVGVDAQPLLAFRDDDFDSLRRLACRGFGFGLCPRLRRPLRLRLRGLGRRAARGIGLGKRGAAEQDAKRLVVSSVSANPSVR